jgi:hypothetical protein
MLAMTPGWPDFMLGTAIRPKVPLGQNNFDPPTPTETKLANVIPDAELSQMCFDILRRLLYSS